MISYEPIGVDLEKSLLSTALLVSLGDDRTDCGRPWADNQGAMMTNQIPYPGRVRHRFLLSVLLSVKGSGGPKSLCHGPMSSGDNTLLILGWVPTLTEADPVLAKQKIAMSCFSCSASSRSLRTPWSS